METWPLIFREKYTSFYEERSVFVMKKFLRRLGLELEMAFYTIMRGYYKIRVLNYTYYLDQVTKYSDKISELETKYTNSFKGRG